MLYQHKQKLRPFPTVCRWSVREPGDWGTAEKNEVTLGSRSNTSNLYSKGEWDETSEGGKGNKCLFCLPKYVSRMGEGTYFCYCWNYQIWEAKGRSQCHSAEMTGTLEKTGRCGRIFIGSGRVNPTSGARSVFWDPLSFFFFFLFLPLFISLKY